MALTLRIQELYKLVSHLKDIYKRIVGFDLLVDRISCKNAILVEK